MPLSDLQEMLTGASFTLWWSPWQADIVGQLSTADLLQTPSVFSVEVFLQRAGQDTTAPALPPHLSYCSLQQFGSLNPSRPSFKQLLELQDVL